MQPSGEPVMHHEDADFSYLNEKIISNEDQTSKRVNRGDQVLVLWPEDNSHYPGTVKHLHRDGQVTVFYDDGDREKLDPWK